MKLRHAIILGTLALACSKPDAKPQEKQLDFSKYKPPSSSFEYDRAPPPKPTKTSAKSPNTARDSHAEPSELSFQQITKEVEAKGFGDLAAILKKREAQSHFKMKMTEQEAKDAGSYILEYLPSMPSTQKLMEILPKTTVELVRAVGERGVSQKDAEQISDYLVNFLDVMKFQNTKSFDENTSHVIGREWQEIDYRGEGMTWRSQKHDWEPLGVINYKKAEYVHNYMKNAATLPYFRRIYHPQGSIRNVKVPWESQ